MHAEKNKCLHCNNEIPKSRKSKIYCSTYCQKRAWRLKRKEAKHVKLICEFCAIEFKTGRAHIQKFCSFSCQQKSNALKHPEWAAHRRTIRRTVEQAANVAWASKEEIKYIYTLAKERGLVVDHIVPLNHADVCGLHVEDNLRCIPASLNLFKSNRYWPDMWKVE